MFAEPTTGPTAAQGVTTRVSTDATAAETECDAGSPPAGHGGVPVQDDFDRDSLHVLPLRIVPLETPGLQHTRLIKNVRLENVIELFNEASSGSGQVYPDHIAIYFESYRDEIERDLVRLRKLSQCNSFDVYSLRIELRRLHIDIRNKNELQLSPRKKQELTEYMKAFTHPLIRQVYGSDNPEVSDVSDIISLFQKPDREEAMRNLRLLAERLHVEVAEIPDFLEDYGDIFLSLAYFQRCLDDIIPEIQRFLEWMRICQESREVLNDTKTKRLLNDIARDLTDISTSLTGRFDSFHQKSRSFWDDINADTFHQVRTLISDNHVTIGGVLCGLAVKMNLWKLRFARGGGGPHRRIEFIKSEILPGLSHINQLERSARSMT